MSWSQGPPSFGGRVTPGSTSEPAPSTFARRAIATDYPLPQGGYLVRTLTSGTDVVVQGAQMLLSEEFRAQVQVGEEGEQK